jgi:hypothetical protein
LRFGGFYSLKLLAFLSHTPLSLGQARCFLHIGTLSQDGALGKLLLLTDDGRLDGKSTPFSHFGPHLLVEFTPYRSFPFMLALLPGEVASIDKGCDHMLVAELSLDAF